MNKEEFQKLTTNSALNMEMLLSILEKHRKETISELADKVKEHLFQLESVLESKIAGMKADNKAMQTQFDIELKRIVKRLPSSDFDYVYNDN